MKKILYTAVMKAKLIVFIMKDHQHLLVRMSILILKSLLLMFAHKLILLIIQSFPFLINGIATQKLAKIRIVQTSLYGFMLRLHHYHHHCKVYSSTDFFLRKSILMFNILSTDETRPIDTSSPDIFLPDSSTDDEGIITFFFNFFNYALVFQKILLDFFYILKWNFKKWI